jgi:hypothetical protein
MSQSSTIYFYDGTTRIEFLSIDQASSKYVTEEHGYFHVVDFGTPGTELSIWHIPGNTGNVVCDMGYTGQLITMSIAYVGPEYLTIQLYESHKETMMVRPFKVWFPPLGYYTRCRLKESRTTMSPKGVSTNDSAMILFESQYMFEVHGTREPLE